MMRRIMSKPQGGSGSTRAMALLRRTTPLFSVLWLAVVALHLSHRPDFSSNMRGSTDNKIHLVYASDDKEIPGVEASIRSVLCHASEPVEIHYVGESPLTSLPQVHYHNLTEVAKQFNLEQFTNPYARTKTFELGLNSNPANYVRFIIDSLLPHAKKAMWIDVDTVVKCDVVGMFRQALSETNYVIAAVPVHRKPMGVNGKVLKSKQFRNLNISFNAGVYVVDLERWRAQHMTRQIRKLTLKNAKKTMYKYGSQPPLVLTIGDQFEHLSWEWNAKADHLDRSAEEPPFKQDACLVHWSGTSKPWDEGGIHTDLWNEPCPVKQNETLLTP